MRTPLSELLGIEHPVIQASLGPWSSVALAAAVSEAGGIGSVGTALMSSGQVADQIRQTRRLTDKPFIVNHTRRPLDEEAFELTLRERLTAELVEAVKAGRGHELVPFTGQTAGMISSVRPAGEIVVEMVADAEQLLARYP